MVAQILFSMVLLTAIALFVRNVRRIVNAISMGRPQSINDQPALRWRKMLLVAIGQGKMVKRPISGFLHIIVYVGFLLVNIEMIEIMIDGIFGTHRIFGILGTPYNWLISGFEMLAIFVIVACIIFLVRRNILKVKRFQAVELTTWPRIDANIILLTEIILMSALLIMNAADTIILLRNCGIGVDCYSFLVSSLLLPIFNNLDTNTLIIIERAGWWIHILGVLAFLNYIPYSKHFHIALAFPNVWFSKLQPNAAMPNMPEVTREVEIMMGSRPESDAIENQGVFGAKDIVDLSWKNIMDSFACTECGRCSAVCPANQTGKKLSPRKIMMDTRDRAEELSLYKRLHGADSHDGKSLLGNYITAEEVWACTTCNACVEECPVTINQVSIILALRRYMVMEQSAAPSTINAMLTNIENNGAPWKYAAADRANWTKELYMNEVK